eukprot:TRINITY_DN549_c0_g1_i12.p1 TRINITY_DN549_c0_g1~~TRINITY_DN549_c0_g1_i12.p1  ORF type:complete len:2034 (-),score=774.81 TRINITY_DN549_c0_g1_i12:60-6089(-)
MSDPKTAPPVKSLEGVPDFQVPKGFICDGTKELLVAHRFLESPAVTAYPIHYNLEYAHYKLSSPEELKFLNVNSPWVLREQIEPNRTEGMQSVWLVNVFDGQVSPHLYDVLRIGQEVVGLRSPSITGGQAYHDDMLTISKAIVAATANSESPSRQDGFLVFTEHNGSLCLLHVQFGVLHLAHFVDLIWESSEKENNVCNVWNVVPNVTQSLLSFWKQSLVKGLSGVHPLNFTPGSSTVMCGFAKSLDDMTLLRSTVEELVESETAPHPLPIVSQLTEEQARIWMTNSLPICFGTERSLLDFNAGLWLMNAAKDIVVLPDSDQNRRAFSFFEQYFGLNDKQVVWVSDDLDQIVEEEDTVSQSEAQSSSSSSSSSSSAISRIQSLGRSMSMARESTVVDDLKSLIVSDDSEFVIVSSPTTSNIQDGLVSLQNAGSVSLFGDDNLASSFSGGSFLFPEFGKSQSTTASNLSKWFPELSIPKGFICKGFSDLQGAFDKLMESGENEWMTVSPASPSTLNGFNFPSFDGVSIANQDQLAYLPFASAQTIVRTPVVVEDANVKFWSIVVIGGKVQKPIVHARGKSEGFEQTGDHSKKISKEQIEFSISVTTELQTRLGFENAFECVFSCKSVEDKVQIENISAGELSINIVLSMLIERWHAASKKQLWRCISWNKLPLPFWNVWDALQNSDLVFVPGQSKYGVMPLVFGNQWNCLFLILGRTNDDIKELEEGLRTLINKIGKNQSTDFNTNFRVRDISRISDGRLWIPNARGVSHYARMQCIPLLRSEKDMVVLPRATATEGSEYIEFVRTVLGIDDEQIIRIDDHDTGVTFDQSLLAQKEHAGQQLEPLLSNKRNKFITMIPDHNSATLEEWATSVPTDKLRIFCEKELEETAIHRTWKAYNDVVADGGEVKPLPLSSFFEVSTNVAVLPGYYCKSAAAVRQAVELLGGESQGVLVRPRSSLGDVKVINSARAAGMHIGSLGESHLVQVGKDLDVTDGSFVVSINIPFAGRNVLSDVILERLVINSEVLAIRSTTQDKACVQQMIEVVEEFASKHGTKGPGFVGFHVRNGKPVVAEVGFSTFISEHFINMFFQIHANQELGFVEVIYRVIPSGVGVWDFWQLLIEQGVAFVPGSSDPAGCFPMSFSHRDRTALCFLGKTRDEVSRHIEAVDMAIEQATGSGLMIGELEMEFGSVMDYSLRRIWVQSCRPEYKRESQRINLSYRSAALVRPGIDVVVLPGEYEAGRAYGEWLIRTLKLEPWQLIFTAGTHYLMDDEIDQRILNELKRIVVSSDEGPSQWLIVPYTLTPNGRRWMKELELLGVKICAESEDWIRKFGTKAILHRHVQTLETPSVLETLGIGKVRVCNGYNCSSNEDLIKAFHMLDCEKVVIKPALGAAGEGIIFVDNEEELANYKFDYGEVSLEEFVDIDRASDGIMLAPACHYFGKELFGSPLVDQIMVSTSYAGWRPSEVSEKVKERCVRTAQGLLKRIKPNGPGGVDFLISHDQPLLSDINTGRFNGAHFPKTFVSAFCKDGVEWIAWKLKPPKFMTIDIYHRRLVAAGLIFQPGESEYGVFPLVFFPPRSGQYVAVGRDGLHVHGMKEKASKLLMQELTDAEIMSQQLMEEQADAEEVDVDDTDANSMILIKNAKVIYTPEVSNHHHMLIGGGKILKFVPDEQVAMFEEIVSETLDVSGMVVTPGFVDVHVHLIGGGGEGGPESRTKEASASKLLQAGITTAIGVLGTDDYSRHLNTLLMKCRGLEELGVSTWMYSGSYRCPPITITESLTSDLCLVDKVIGVGELAISDHRGSFPTLETLLSVANDCRIGGMLSGKKGVMYCHMGSEKTKLDPLFEMVERGVPIESILPTHVSRTEELFEHSLEWLERGGYIDLTAGPNVPCKAMHRIRSEGYAMDRVMFSSDACGSRPVYNENHELIGYGEGSANTLLQTFRSLYYKYTWALEEILPLVTSTPADFMMLKGKGHLAVDKDADVLVFDPLKMELKVVISMGKIRRDRLEDE